MTTLVVGSTHLAAAFAYSLEHGDPDYLRCYEDGVRVVDHAGATVRREDLVALLAQAQVRVVVDATESPVGPIALDLAQVCASAAVPLLRLQPESDPRPAPGGAVAHDVLTALRWSAGQG